MIRTAVTFYGYFAFSRRLCIHWCGRKKDGFFTCARNNALKLMFGSAPLVYGHSRTISTAFWDCQLCYKMQANHFVLFWQGSSVLNQICPKICRVLSSVISSIFSYLFML